MAGGLAISILSVMVHRYVLLNSGAGLTRLYYGTDTRADALLMGCLLALLPLSRIAARGKRLLNVAGVLSVTALFYFVAVSNFSDPFLYRGGYTLIAILSGIVVWVAATSSPGFLSIALRSSALRWFGKISYGLYLWHWLVVRSTSFYYLGYWEPWAKFALSLGIASASFYILERPFIRLKTRFAARPLASQPNFHAGLTEVRAEKPQSSLPIPA